MSPSADRWRSPEGRPYPLCRCRPASMAAGIFSGCGRISGPRNSARRLQAGAGSATREILRSLGAVGRVRRGMEFGSGIMEIALGGFEAAFGKTVHSLAGEKLHGRTKPSPFEDWPKIGATSKACEGRWKASAVCVSEETASSSARSAPGKSNSTTPTRAMSFTNSTSKSSPTATRERIENWRGTETPAPSPARQRPSKNLLEG
jgi:hypothetical protein